MSKRLTINVTLLILGVTLGALFQPFNSLLSLAQGDCRTFPETGKQVCGRFLEYWDGAGGLAQQGYPISDPMSEVSDTDGKTYTIQYFERAVFELHPENYAPNDVLLSLLGVFRYQERYQGSAPNQVPNVETGSQLFSETNKRVGGLFLDYWKRHGGLAQQGFPISDEFVEVSELNGQSYKVQYFQRAVFELHPENPDPYKVLLSQLGTFRYSAQYVAGKSTPPPAPTPVVLSAEYVIGVLKSAGLPIGQSVVYNEATDPNNLIGRPGQYVAKGTWHDTRLEPPTALDKLGVDDGGGVEIFATNAAAQKRYEYIKAIGEGSPLFLEYGYVQGVVYLRVSKELTPSQFEEYKNAIKVIPTSP
jgi:hypothetical protein